MTTNEKIARIRQLMARDQVQAVIILGNEDNFIFSSSNLRNTYF